MLRKTILAFAATCAVFAAVAPASAANYYMGNGHQRHCWTQRQKVVIHTRHGDRLVWRSVRVCGRR